MNLSTNIKFYKLKLSIYNFMKIKIIFKINSYIFLLYIYFKKI